MGIHKGWSPDDYRKWAASGYTMAETAREMGVRPQTVAVMAARYDITFVRGKNGRKADAGKAE